MPNAELFAINPNSVHMIAKCKRNLKLALWCNLGISFQIHPICKKRIATYWCWKVAVYLGQLQPCVSQGTFLLIFSASPTVCKYVPVAKHRSETQTHCARLLFCSIAYIRSNKDDQIANTLWWEPVSLIQNTLWWEPVSLIKNILKGSDLSRKRRSALRSRSNQKVLAENLLPTRFGC